MIRNFSQTTFCDDSTALTMSGLGETTFFGMLYLNPVFYYDTKTNAAAQWRSIKNDPDTYDAAAKRNGPGYVAYLERIAYLQTAMELRPLGLFNLEEMMKETDPSILLYEKSGLYPKIDAYGLLMENLVIPGDRAQYLALVNDRPGHGRTALEMNSIARAIGKVEAYINEIVLLKGYDPQEMDWVFKINQFKRYVEQRAGRTARDVKKGVWPTTTLPTTGTPFDLEKIKEYAPYIGIGLGLFRLLF